MIKKLKQSELYNDEKYKIISLSDEQKDLRRILCDTDSICIIPFDTKNNKVSNLYLAKYEDYLNDSKGHTCIAVDSKKDTNHTSEFESVSHIIKDELNIEVDVDDLYFLGNVKHSLPFTKKYKCYGVNLDNYSDKLNGFKLDISDDELIGKLYQLDKVKLTRILKGDIEDSLAMSATMLLTSYID